MPNPGLTVASGNAFSSWGETSVKQPLETNDNIFQFLVLSDYSLFWRMEGKVHPFCGSYDSTAADQRPTMFG